MTRRLSTGLWLAGLTLGLVMAASCGQRNLPEVPAFEDFGFDESLDAVHEQMQTVYAAWQAQPLDPERNGRLGMHLSTYRKAAAAEVLYRRAKALAPDEFRWTYYLAFTLLDFGRDDEAAEMFREALTLRPEHAESRIQLAQLMLKSGDTQQSLALFEAITVAHSDRVEGWLGLGKVYQRLGDHDAAIAALEHARLVGPQFGEVYFALGEALRAKGDKDAAARELANYQRYADNRIRAADKLLLEVGALNASDVPHMAQGRYYRQHAQFDQAAVSFRAALEVNPANQDAWIELVATQGELGEIEAAGDTYRRALDAGIAYAPLHLAYGQALLDARRLAPARDAIAKSLELDPQNAAANAAMGRVEMLSGESPAAVESFRRALAARPDDFSVKFELARALNAAGRYEEAASQLDLLTTEPMLEQSRTLMELARSYHGMGREQEAIDTLERGREVARRSANVRMADAIDALLSEWK